MATTTGFEGINDYGSPNDNGANCQYGDRGGASYVEKLAWEIRNTTSNAFKWVNALAWEQDLHAGGEVDKAEFFAYSGHGFRYDSYNNTNGAAVSHFSSPNSSTQAYHSWRADREDDLSVNATWDEVRFRVTKWASFYSCNWLAFGPLTTNKQKVGKMFEGLRIMTGFASIMWLDSREGEKYGFLLNSGVTFKEAWFAAADQYQPQNSDPVYVRIFGHRNAISTDTLYSTVNNAPKYIDAPNDFITEDHIIP